MTVEIPLHSKKYPGMVALVDDEDYELVSGYSWFPAKRDRTFYAIAHTTVDGKQTMVYMHRLILDIPGLVDHVSRDGTDNRKTNLRPATYSQNNANRIKPLGVRSSRFKGVCWHRSRAKWRADITVNGRLKFLGYFSDEITAAYAYDAAAVEYFGEFACLNFPVPVVTVPVTVNVQFTFDLPIAA